MTEFSPEDLRDNPANIASHLDKAFKTDDLVCIFKAFNEAMRAQNVSAVARTMGVRRERLYTTFGGEIDPNFSRVLKLLEGLDVQITIKPRQVRTARPPLPKLGRPRKPDDE